MNKDTVTLELYRPHDGQKIIHKSNARHRIIAAGRRFGKTQLAANEMVKFVWENPKEIGWWVAPTYAQSKIGFDLIRRYFNKIIAKVRTQDKEIEFKYGGGLIRFRSADEPDNLRGYGMKFLVVDEARYISDEAWYEVLRPALADKQGRLLAISTPKGKHNWFYKVFQAPSKDYQGFQMPTHLNPYVPDDELKELEETLPERVYRQEILAEFIDDAGGVFRGVANILQEYDLPVAPQGRVYMGVDLARYEDFTVIIAVDETGKIVFFDRFNQLKWDFQKERIIAAAKMMNPVRIVMDSTGIGDPIVEELRSYVPNIVGVKLNNSSKEMIINKLAIKIENREIIIPVSLTDLRKELEIYEYQLSPSGKLRMAAPKGFHDDCVMAMALAVSEMDYKGQVVMDRPSYKREWGWW